MPQIRIDKINISQANKISYQVLKDIYSLITIRLGNRDINLELSRGIFYGNKLVGVYLLKNQNDPHNILKGSGIRGICLAVLPEYQGKGFGKLLINYAESLPFDYIYGGNDKKLNNLHHWLKRRTLYHESDTAFYTYKILKKEH